MKKNSIITAVAATVVAASLGGCAGSMVGQPQKTGEDNVRPYITVINHNCDCNCCNGNHIGNGDSPVVSTGTTNYQEIYVSEDGGDTYYEYNYFENKLYHNDITIAPSWNISQVLEYTNTINNAVNNIVNNNIDVTNIDIDINKTEINVDVDVDVTVNEQKAEPTFVFHDKTYTKQQAKQLIDEYNAEAQGYLDQMVDEDLLQKEYNDAVAAAEKTYSEKALNYGQWKKAHCYQGSDWYLKELYNQYINDITAERDRAKNAAMAKLKAALERNEELAGAAQSIYDDIKPLADWYNSLQ